ncbi:uncharacterized protein LOC109599270 isoform X2 [Aethina tumida]|nr:uncharacterized protein LOC109599270 isoform X2 [Aethina tumida]
MMKQEKRFETSRKISPALPKQTNTLRATSPNSNNSMPLKKTTKHHATSPPTKHISRLEEPDLKSKMKSVKKSNNETWANCLKNNKTKDPYGFNKYDPLRLVHFLTKELKSHVQNILPEDDCTRDMLGQLETALNRVPPEVATAIHLQQAIEFLPRSKSHSSINDEKPEKLEKSKKLQCKSIQTLTDKEDDNLHKMMVENTEKLEAQIKLLEETVEKLKQENEQKKNKLAVEKDNVAYYKGRLEELEKNHAETVNVKIYKMEEEKSTLETQISQLKLQLADVSKPREELRVLIKEMKKNKSDTDAELMKLRHQLKLSEIEKEKYMAVLAVRDRQINEIRNEMSQLQEVVNEQLMELHSNAFSNLPSQTCSDSDIISESKETGDSLPSPITRGNPRYKRQEEMFKNMPEGDITDRDKIFENLIDLENEIDHVKPKDKIDSEKPPLYEATNSQVSIKDVLTELKRQVYSVSGQSMSS